MILILFLSLSKKYYSYWKQLIKCSSDSQKNNGKLPWSLEGKKKKKKDGKFSAKK